MWWRCLCQVAVFQLIKRSASEHFLMYEKRSLLVYFIGHSSAFLSLQVPVAIEKFMGRVTFTIPFS
jgi:hypothetical protein